jgi:hypothetical protein
MFPREVMNRFPLLPREEEDRLNDMPLRENLIDAIRDERVYILTHPDMMPFVAVRVGALMEGKNPLPMS